MGESKNAIPPRGCAEYTIQQTVVTIEQLADGSVTLWFEFGSEEFWNAGTMTYSDEANSVTIKGITADAVSLKFGDVETAIAGAFENAASEKIFEDQDKALIA